MPSAKNPAAVMLENVPKKAVTKDIFYYCEPFGAVEGVEFVDSSTVIVTFKFNEDAAALKAYKKFSILHSEVTVKYYDRRPVQPKQSEQKKTESKPLPVQPAKKQPASTNVPQQQRQQPAANNNVRNTQNGAQQNNQRPQYNAPPQQQQQQQPEKVKPSRMVVFHNVPHGLSTEDVEYEATAFGQVKSTEWISRSSIIVEYKSPAAAARVLEVGDSFTLQGKPVRVREQKVRAQEQPAQPQRQQQQPSQQHTQNTGNNRPQQLNKNNSQYQQQQQQEQISGLSKKEQKLVKNLEMVKADIDKQIRDIKVRK